MWSHKASSELSGTTCKSIFEVISSPWLILTQFSWFFSLSSPRVAHTFDGKTEIVSLSNHRIFRNEICKLTQQDVVMGFFQLIIYNMQFFLIFRRFLFD